MSNLRGCEVENNGLTELLEVQVDSSPQQQRSELNIPYLEAARSEHAEQHDAQPPLASLLVQTSSYIFSCEIVAPMVIHYLGCHRPDWSPVPARKHYGRCGGLRNYQILQCSCCAAQVYSGRNPPGEPWEWRRYPRCQECVLMFRLTCISRSLRDMTRRYNGVSLPLGPPRPLEPPRIKRKSNC